MEEENTLANRVLSHDPTVLPFLETASLSEVFLIHQQEANLLECALISDNSDALKILCLRGAECRIQFLVSLTESSNWFHFYRALRQLVYHKIIDIGQVGPMLMQEAQRHSNYSALICLFRLGIPCPTIRMMPDWYFFAQMFVVSENIDSFHEFMSSFRSKSFEKEGEYEDSPEGWVEASPLNSFFLLAAAHGSLEAVSLILLHRCKDLPRECLQQGLNLASLNNHEGVFRSIMHYLEILNGTGERVQELCREAFGIALRYKSSTILRLLITGYDALKPSFLTFVKNFVRSTLREQRAVIGNHPQLSSVGGFLLICILIYYSSLLSS